MPSSGEEYEGYTKTPGGKLIPKVKTGSLYGVVAAWLAPNGDMYAFSYGGWDHDTYAKKVLGVKADILERRGWKRFHKGVQGCIVYAGHTDRATEAQLETVDKWYADYDSPPKNNPSSGDVYRTAARMLRLHSPAMAAWWAELYATEHRGKPLGDKWHEVFLVLKKRDKQLRKKKVRHHPGSVRAAIKSWETFGHIRRNPPLTLDEAYEKAWLAWPVFQKIVETPPDVACVAFSSTDAINGSFYNLRKLPGLSSPISVGIHTGHFSFSGKFMPERPEDMPAWVKIKFPFLTIYWKLLIWRWPMFAHEFTHALQWERDGKFSSTHGETIADYWNNPSEFFAYQVTIRAFVQQELESIFKSKAGAKTAGKKFKAIFKSPHMDIQGFKNFTPENAKRMLDYFDSLKNGATAAFVDRYKTLPE